MGFKQESEHSIEHGNYPILMQQVGGGKPYICENGGPVEQASYCHVRTMSGESFVPALGRVHAQDSPEDTDI